MCFGHRHRSNGIRLIYLFSPQTKLQSQHILFEFTANDAPVKLTLQFLWGSNDLPRAELWCGVGVFPLLMPYIGRTLWCGELGRYIQHTSMWRNSNTCRFHVLMMMSWHGNAFRITSTLLGEFMAPPKWQVMRSLDVFFVVSLKNLLNKHSSCRWFETPERSRWSSGWQLLYSLGTLKLVFNVSSEYQGCHPDDLFVSVHMM